MKRTTSKSTDTKSKSSNTKSIYTELENMAKKYRAGELKFGGLKWHE